MQQVTCFASNGFEIITNIMFKRIVSPILDRLDSETWHNRARELLHLSEISPFTLKQLELFAYKGKRIFNERLKVKIEDIEFDNPLVVGAGWDKVGRAVKALYRLGFAGVEVGTVLQYPQPGNAKPRQFVLAPGVALNRLGFNSPGMNIVANNLKRYKNGSAVVGVSIGKNKNVPKKDAPKAHSAVIKKLYKYAAFFVINVSSPNTPGLRQLQDKAPLAKIVKAINRAMDKVGKRKPLFVKIAPDLTNSAVDDVIEVVIENKLTGIVATNTTNNSDIKAKYGEKWRNQMVGISGNDKDFRQMATDKIAYIYKKTRGRIKIIGVGGVNDTKSALEKIMSGASLLQIVTGIRGEGTSLPGKINQGILDYLDKKGIENVERIVGIRAKKLH